MSYHHLITTDLFKSLFKITLNFKSVANLLITIDRNKWGHKFVPNFFLKKLNSDALLINFWIMSRGMFSNLAQNTLGYMNQITQETEWFNQETVNFA